MRSQQIAELLNKMPDVIAAVATTSNQVNGRCMDDTWVKIAKMFPRAKATTTTKLIYGNCVYFTIPDGAVYMGALFKPEPKFNEDSPKITSAMEEAVFSPDGRITVSIHPGNNCELLYIKGSYPAQPEQDAEWFRIEGAMA